MKREQEIFIVIVHLWIFKVVVVVVVVGYLLLIKETLDNVLYVDLNVLGKVVLLLMMVNVRLNWKELLT